MDDITILLETIQEETKNLCVEMFDTVRDMLEDILNTINPEVWMCEDVCINDAEYIFDWNSGHILIVDELLYIRFRVDKVDNSINGLLKELLFAKVIKNALNGDYGKWKAL